MPCQVCERAHSPACPSPRCASNPRRRPSAPRSSAPAACRCKPAPTAGCPPRIRLIASTVALTADQAEEVLEHLQLFGYTSFAWRVEEALEEAYAAWVPSPYKLKRNIRGTVKATACMVGDRDCAGLFWNPKATVEGQVCGESSWPCPLGARAKRQAPVVLTCAPPSQPLLSRPSAPGDLARRP